jgi:hypothetical protein
MTTQFTDNQTAILYGIDLSQGAWFDDVVNQAAAESLNKDKKQARVTLNQLIKKGTLAVDTTKEEGSSWLTVVAPENWFAGYRPYEEEEDDLLGDIEVPDTPAQAEDLLGDSDEDLLGDDDEDLLGDVAALVPTTPEGVLLVGVETTHDTVTKDQVVTHSEHYTVNEWVDADEVQWTETLFSDGSRTIKRRRLVSDSWRTDYWGAEFTGDKERATTAKLAKMARAYGSFTHNPVAREVVN